MSKPDATFGVHTHMPRIFDLIAVAAVAVVVLLPKASVEAKPALTGSKIEIDHIAELEDLRFIDPNNVDRACDLAEAYLGLLHPDWALSTLASLGVQSEVRVHLLRATAHAERLEAQAAVDEATRGKSACDALGARCNPSLRIRLDIIEGPMQVLVDQHLDPRQNPKEAADAVSKVLHSTHSGGLTPHK
jgi:hypothetical protein